MVVFTGKPYEMDMLYMKIAGSTEVASIPVCEAFTGVRNVKYHRDRTMSLSEKNGSYTVCFTADTDKDKNKSFDIPIQQLATTLEAEIFSKQCKISNIAVQPEGELLVTEVLQLIES